MISDVELSTIQMRFPCNSSMQFPKESVINFPDGILNKKIFLMNMDK